MSKYINKETGIEIKIETNNMYAFIVINDLLHIDYNYIQFELDEIDFKYKEKYYQVYDNNNYLNEENAIKACKLLGFNWLKLIENVLMIDLLSYTNEMTLNKQMYERGFEKVED